MNNQQEDKMVMIALIQLMINKELITSEQVLDIIYKVDNQK